MQTPLSTIRRDAAYLMRDIRAMYPGLKGGWSRREWNAQARTAGRGYVKNMIRFYRVNSD